jgi:hypothetical protein
LGEIDKAIERYLGELDRADEVFEQTGTVLPEARMERTLRKLEHLQKEAKRYRSIEQRMDETGETQVSFSDPDARSMATTARMPRIVGYNVQTAVEADNHLIVAHEVTMLGFDRDALSMMAVAANDVMTTDQLTAIADKGYYKGEEIVASEEAGVSVLVPKPMTSNAAARGQFDKADFAYDSNKDVYVCPAGQNLTYRFTSQQDGKALKSYWSGACVECALKSRCTTGKERRVRRWEKEDVLERVQRRLDADPAQLAVRSMTVEHPYGTIKSWMGATHFKMRRLKNVATEMALHVLAYNMTRVMNMMGIPAMIAAMKA